MEGRISRSKVLAQKGLLDVSAGAGLVAVGVANAPFFLHIAEPQLGNLIATTENPLIGITAAATLMMDFGISLVLPFVGALKMAKGSALLAAAGGCKIAETALRFSSRTRTRRTSAAGIALA